MDFHINSLKIVFWVFEAVRIVLACFKPYRREKPGGSGLSDLQLSRKRSRNTLELFGGESQQRAVAASLCACRIDIDRVRYEWRIDTGSG